jgi:hypothetical protein
VSLMEALVAVCNETRLRSAGLLESTSSSVLAARSASSGVLGRLPRGLLRYPLALGLTVQVDFIVITAIEMHMMRLTISRRRGSRLSLAKVGVLRRVLVV